VMMARLDMSENQKIFGCLATACQAAGSTAVPRRRTRAASVPDESGQCRVSG
jgi:hypothetical protein